MCKSLVVVLILQVLIIVEVTTIIILYKRVLLTLFKFYRFHTGVELFRAGSHAGGDTLLKLLWQHSDAIMCCSLKASLKLLHWYPVILYFKVGLFSNVYGWPNNIFWRLYILQQTPVFTFANQAGLDMLETTLIALQDITFEKILDDGGRKVLCNEFPKIMQQVSIKNTDLKD